MWLQNEALSLVLKGAYFECSSIRSLLFYYKLYVLLNKNKQIETIIL